MQKRSITRAALEKLKASWAVSPLPDPEAIPDRLWLVSNTVSAALTITDEKPSVPSGYKVEKLVVKG